MLQRIVTTEEWARIKRVSRRRLALAESSRPRSTDRPADADTDTDAKGSPR